MRLLLPLRICLVALPICLHLALLLNCSTNVPFQDDYDAIIGWLSDYLKAPSAGSKISMLVAQQTEHRVLMIHLATLLLHYCKWGIDFKILALMGNAFLAFLLGLLFVSFRPREQRGWLFIPAIYIFLQPQYYEMLFWSTASLAYYPVVFFSLVSFYLFDRESKFQFAVALISGVLAAFTLSSGILALVLGIAICLLNRSYFRSLIVGAVLILTVCLFFFSYDAVSPSAQIGVDLNGVLTIGEYFLNWIGCVPALSQPYRSAIAGAFILAFYLLLILMRYDKQNKIVFFGLSFLFASGLINAWYRALEFGPRYALTEVRYRFFSSAILVLSYLALVQVIAVVGGRLRIKAHVYQAVLIVIGIAFWTRSWIAYVDAGPEIRNALVEKAITTKIGTGAPFYPDQMAAHRRLDDAEVHGIFKITPHSLGLAGPDQIPSKVHSIDVECDGPKSCYALRIEELHNTRDGLYVRGWAYSSSQLSNQGSIFLRMKDASGQAIFIASRTTRLDLARHGMGLQALRAGFMCFIPASLLRSAEVSIALAILQPDRGLPWQTAWQRFDGRQYSKWSFQNGAGGS